ncbi:hypothetical protein ACWCQ1_39650 [Streptomyces sp. NPDC002144]
MDEKSKMQAIDRPAPILPALPTTTARMSHDYEGPRVFRTGF